MMKNPFQRRAGTGPPIDHCAGKLIGGRLVCGPTVLPVLDLCWSESTMAVGTVSGVRGWTPPPDQQVIVGSVAFVSGSVQDIRGYQGKIFYISGETTVVLEEAEIIDLRTGQLIHPGHQFISFVCRTLEITDEQGTRVYGRTGKIGSSAGKQGGHQ